MEGKVKGLKRWAPVIGTGTLVVSVALRYFGQHEAAGAVEGLANATGLADGAAFSVAELTAAVAAAVGVVMKVVSQVKKAANTPLVKE